MEALAEASRGGAGRSGALSTCEDEGYRRFETLGETLSAVNADVDVDLTMSW